MIVEATSGWVPLEVPVDQGPVEYMYRGPCPISGAEMLLPRTRYAEHIARQLQAEFQRLNLGEGKMFGVLIGRQENGECGFFKAFSGQVQGATQLPGWAPPLHLATPTASEEITLQRLAEAKAALIELDRQCREHAFPALETRWKEREEEVRERHRRAKQQRDRERATRAASELDRESRQDSLEWRDLGRAKRLELAQPQANFNSLRERIRQLKMERASWSRALQAEMHEQMTNSVSGLLGCSLHSLYPGGIRTGTGDCCAPKLLAWAMLHGVRPVALAEFWWGPELASGKRVAGQFYPACQERCQPLLGPLLAAALRPPVKVLYRDDCLLAVDKPGGLLSVPGRNVWAQNSVLTVLRQRWPQVLPVHRLDLETSGVLLFALDPQAQSHLRMQFERRSVNKTYTTRLSRCPGQEEGRIDACLGPDPHNPGRYRLDPEGKSAVTEYRMLDATLAELRPLSGRSHQLRVHLAQALGCPIRGDHLYGQGGERLHLHATSLEITHPRNGQRLVLQSTIPF